MTALVLCSCGEAKPHVIARRSTADGKLVYLWDDGGLTWALGYWIRGALHPRTVEQQARALRVGWLVLGEVELYAAAEVPEVVRAARWAAERDGLPGTLRRRLWTERRRAELPTPVWRIMAADRRGRPTERVWVFPRLSPWRDHAVWDERDTRGRYHLHRRCVDPVPGVRGLGADPAFEWTGISFDNLDALLTWLAENTPRVVELPEP